MAWTWTPTESTPEPTACSERRSEYRVVDGRGDVMPVERICYRRLRRYKYQLMERYECRTPIVGQLGAVGDGWVELDDHGVLKTKKGYAWDGPSGPTIDTKSFMRGSLVHDALYQLMREGVLGQEYRKCADRLLLNICRADGMSWPRATWVYLAIRACGWRFARPGQPAAYEYAP